MNLPVTIWGYFSRRYFYYFFLVLLVLTAMIFIIDLLEVLRRSFHRDLSFGDILRIVLYKLPYFVQLIIPFAILIGGAFSLNSLNRNNELIVTRGAGISAWAFLAPMVLSAFFIGVICVTMVNPFVAATFKKHLAIEAKYIRGQANLVSISDYGVWLKDIKDDRIDKIIYAKELHNQGKYLSEVSLFIAGENFDFIKRIEADLAVIKNKQIILSDVKIYTATNDVLHEKTYILDTNLVLEHLQGSVELPEMISFWNLYQFCQKLEKTGFSALKHKLYFYNLLLSPLFFVSLVLIASSFSLSLPRKGRLGFMMFVTVSVGFIVFFLSKFTYALTLSGAIGLGMGAISPVLICFFIAVYLLLHYEDG